MALPSPDENTNPVTIWGYLVMGASALGGAGLVFWRWFINNRLSDTATNAQLEIIRMLQDQVVTERTRADALSKQRDDALDAVRQLKDTVAQQTQQIANLTAQVQHLESTVKAYTPPATP